MMSCHEEIFHKPARWCGCTWQCNEWIELSSTIVTKHVTSLAVPILILSIYLLVAMMWNSFFSSESDGPNSIFKSTDLQQQKMFFSHASLLEIFFDMLGLVELPIQQLNPLLGVHSNSTHFCLVFLPIPKSITSGTGNHRLECSSLGRQLSNFLIEPFTLTRTSIFMWNIATASLLHCG